MTKAPRSIFREQALKSYIERREKDVLPQLVTPPVFLFLWILLGLLITAGLLAWLAQVPTYLEGTGIILEQPLRSISGQREAVAVIFFPALSASKVRAGLPVQVLVGTTGAQFTGTIDTVEPGFISPDEARQRFALGNAALQVVSGPSVAVTVPLGAAFPAQTFAGSVVHAQVQVGTQRLLSLLPVLGPLIRR